MKAFHRQRGIVKRVKSVKESSEQNVSNEQYDIDWDSLTQVEPFKNVMSIVNNLRRTHGNYQSVTALLHRIYADFGIEKIFTDPNTPHAKSLYQLLDIALQFDTGIVEYTKSLASFLLYADDKYNDIKPDGVENTNAVKLMTIHKSKGLQFDNVFVCNVLGSNKRDSNPLQSIFGYSEDYSSVRNLLMMKNKYHKMIANCGDCISNFNDESILKSAIENIILTRKKEFIGKMNNFYVALTRPVMNLIVYNIIQSSEGYSNECKALNDKSIDDIDEWLNQKNIVLALYEKYIKKGDDSYKDRIEVDDTCLDEPYFIEGYSFGEWELVPPKKNKDKDKPDYRPKKEFKQQNFLFDKMPKYIDYNLWQSAAMAAAKESSLDEQFDEKIEQGMDNYSERKRLFGIAVHYYMSKIIYGTDEEKAVAKQTLYTKYGNILDDEAIDNVARAADKFIKDYHDELFDCKEWDRVLNEQWLTDESGNMRRLDRIMFNTNEKKILIADYKTGKEDELQLKNYKALVAKLVGDDYKIENIRTKDYKVY